MIHIIDSEIYCGSWGTNEMRSIFDERSRLQSWLDIIAVLAEAQAEIGIIPTETAAEIRRVCNLEIINLDSVRNGYEETGHSVLGLIQELKRHCQNGAGEWVYYGATVQDITDTWLAIALLKSWNIVFRDLLEIENYLLSLSKKHALTVMWGRTHGQPGLPITFGFKAAVWAAEVRRHVERFKSLKGRLGEGQLAGAVGSLSVFGNKGLDLQRLFLSKLGLRSPIISWLTSRDNLVEFVNLLALIGNTFDKIGHEIYNLQRPEIGEVSEAFVYGNVGSITMPHKRNPERSEHIGTLARIIRSHANCLSENMVHEHERDGRSWKSEWGLVPPVFVMAGALLQISKQMCSSLIANCERMKENLDNGLGSVFSESVMIALAQKVGKQSAHELVYRASMQSFEERRHLYEIVKEDPLISQTLTVEEIEHLFCGENLIGLSDKFIRQVEDYSQSFRETDDMYA